ncbi:hypothetical protein SGLAM104S_06646 [Streptomyces glaucescens]
MPEPASQAVAGRAPMPTTTAPAGSRVPSPRTTAPGSTRSTRASSRSSAPASAYQAAIGAATSAGSAPASGRAAASTTVTAQPASRAAVANSAPIQPGADDHDVVLPAEHRPQPLGVVQGAQQVHPGHALGARQRDRRGAGGDDQDVVRHRSGLGVQLVAGGAHAEHLAAEAQLDAERLEVDVEGGALGGAEQDGLGQRRPVVRLMGLRADQGDRAGEVLFAQGDRGLHAGHARAGHDHPPRCGRSPFLRLLAHLITIDN